MLTDEQLNDPLARCCGRCKKFVPRYPGNISLVTGDCGIRTFSGIHTCKGNHAACDFFVMGSMDMSTRGAGE